MMYWWGLDGRSGGLRRYRLISSTRWPSLIFCHWQTAQGTVQESESQIFNLVATPWERSLLQVRDKHLHFQVLFLGGSKQRCVGVFFCFHNTRLAWNATTQFYLVLTFSLITRSSHKFLSVPQSTCHKVLAFPFSRHLLSSDLLRFADVHFSGSQNSFSPAEWMFSLLQQHFASHLYLHCVCRGFSSPKAIVEPLVNSTLPFPYQQHSRATPSSPSPM